MRFDAFVLHRRITCLSDDSVEIYLLIHAGSCLKMLRGWLECLCMYDGSSLGFLQDLYFPVVRSKVTSRKFSTCKVASAVNFPQVYRHALSSRLQVTQNFQ